MNAWRKHCALKWVPFSKHPSEMKTCLRNEIKFLQALRGCKWIVQMYHADITNDRALIAMELGEINFEALIRSQDRDGVDMEFTRMYWRHMLNAVQAIHALNIVHTDLKPENFVLIKGKLKLIDFGIARAIPKDKTSIIVEDEVCFAPSSLTSRSARWSIWPLRPSTGRIGPAPRRLALPASR